MVRPRVPKALKVKQEHPYVNVKPSELTEELNNLLEKYQDIGEPHGVPSPSGSEGCQREQVWSALGIPPSNRKSVSTILAAEQGKAEEGIVTRLLEEAGYTIVATQLKVDGSQIGCPGGGTIDSLIEKDGELWIEDTKRMGLWRYLSLVKDGCKKAHPSYYTQLQLYMKATGIKKSLLIAISADASAINYVWNMRSYGDQYKPPPIWVEEIHENPMWQGSRIRRNLETIKLIEMNQKTPPRDFDPETTVFPCGYCSFKELCLERGE